VPECEILAATHAVRNFIRTREFFRIAAALETGAEHDMWSFQRYAKWLDNRTGWSLPAQISEPPDNEPSETAIGVSPLPPNVTAQKSPKRSVGSVPVPTAKEGSRIEIEPVEGGLGKILKKLE